MGSAGFPDISNLDQPVQQQQTPDQIEQLKQSLAQQAMPKAQPTGGPIRRLLQNFIGGMGQSMMHEAGLATDYERQQKAVGNLTQIENMQQMADLHRAMAGMYGTRPVQLPDGSTVNVMAKDVAGLQGKILSSMATQTAAQTKTLNVPGVGAFAFDQDRGGYFPIQGSQAQMPVLDEATAQLAGMPQLAGQPVNEATLTNANKALQARGLHVQDMAKNGTDENSGMWLMDRAGNKIKQISPNSMVYQRGVSFAQSRAMYTPFETVEPGTNEPTTISNLQAIHTGAPRVPIGTQIKLGGQYALFNDAYGILDNVEKAVGSGPGQVNLDDPAVRARVTAGYAALKEPAAKGLTGEVLSNFLARQPISASLSPEERELALTFAQGKAAATGLRGILGQAGTNEMQQRLDSAMMPGPQAANNDGIKQQTKAMRGLLDRVAVGQPQAGLNAPGQPNALNQRGSLTADEARAYLLKAGGNKDKARALARADGRKF